MAEHVQITVRSTSRFGGQEDQLIFRGTGTLEKLPEWTEESLPEGWHLRYEAANEADGSAIVSDVKLETATHRAVVINEADSGGYGLLLDPKTPTATRIDGGDGGSLTLNVVTQEVAWQLSRQGHGFITLAYTLLIGTQPLSVLRVELTLTKEENRT